MEPTLTSQCSLCRGSGAIDNLAANAEGFKALFEAWNLLSSRAVIDALPTRAAERLRTARTALVDGMVRLAPQILCPECGVDDDEI